MSSLEILVFFQDLLLMSFFVDLGLLLVELLNGHTSSSKIRLLKFGLELIISLESVCLSSNLILLPHLVVEFLLQLSLVLNLARHSILSRRQVSESLFTGLKHLFEHLSNLLIVRPTLQILFGNLHFQS